jgi:hypothetical protein
LHMLLGPFKIPFYSDDALKQVACVRMRSPLA